MVLMGLGGCTSIDVVDILKKSRQDITDCVTQLTAERAEHHTRGVHEAFTFTSS